MAQDKIIPRNAPGIAGFATESIGGAGEPRFGDGQPTTTTAKVGPDTTLELYHVVARVGGFLVPAVFGGVGGGAAAVGLLTFSGAGTAGDTITIDDHVYELVAALSAPATPNEVVIGATAAVTAANLRAAINHDDGEGVLYSEGTYQHATVGAAEGASPNIVRVTASVVGDESNTIATTETSSAASWGGATLTGGDDDSDLRPYGITTAPVVTGAGQQTTMDIYRGGHWDMDQLVWDESFDTDEKKKLAFEGSLSPNVFISKKKFNNSAIDV